jgi:hypothetical protein
MLAIITCVNSKLDAIYSCSTCGGGTPGFWSNKNGLALITQADIDYLNSLGLVDASGNLAGPFTFDNKKAFSNWIKARNAKDMRYQLSGHLAAFVLNVRHEKWGLFEEVADSGFTATLLIDEAIMALADSDTPHEWLELLKDIMDWANNEADARSCE